MYVIWIVLNYNMLQRKSELSYVLLNRQRIVLLTMQIVIRETADGKGGSNSRAIASEEKN